MHNVCGWVAVDLTNEQRIYACAWVLDFIDVAPSKFHLVNPLNFSLNLGPPSKYFSTNPHVVQPLSAKIHHKMLKIKLITNY